MKQYVASIGDKYLLPPTSLVCHTICLFIQAESAAGFVAGFTIVFAAEFAAEFAAGFAMVFTAEFTVGFTTGLTIELKICRHFLSYKCAYYG
jgi:hypothetical protein